METLPNWAKNLQRMDRAEKLDKIMTKVEIAAALLALGVLVLVGQGLVK